MTRIPATMVAAALHRAARGGSVVLLGLLVLVSLSLTTALARRPRNRMACGGLAGGV